MLKKILRLGALAAMVLAGSGAQAQEVVVGQVAPLSGVLASTGAQMVLGPHLF
jgi:branched-chain amino acid transport system substrate-binding protein